MMATEVSLLFRNGEQYPQIGVADGTEMRAPPAHAAEGMFVFDSPLAPGSASGLHRLEDPTPMVAPSGAWRYPEQSTVERTSSNVHEPVAASHTLTVSKDGGSTEVWSVAHGPLESVDPPGTASETFDAAGARRPRRDACAAAGLPAPDVLDVR